MAHIFKTEFKPDGSPYTFCSQCGKTEEFLSDPARFVDGVPPRCLFAPLAPARADPAPGIYHALPFPPSGANRKLVINATIFNRQTDACIHVQLHVDGGCEAFELVLLPEDVEALGITPTGELEQGVQQDGSVLTLAEYSRVRVVLTHSDETEETATLMPVVQAPLATEGVVTGHVVPANATIQRLLGYGGLTRFGLKQDLHFLKRA